MVKCKICEKEFTKDKGLHLHLKAHKISVKDYYHNHYPRYDLHTKKLIKFKNKDKELHIAILCSSSGTIHGFRLFSDQEIF